MGIERKAVVFYRNFYEAIKGLPVELKAEVYDAVMEYGLNGEEPTALSTMARTIFVLIKPSIDTNNTRYENGKGGGRPKKHEEQTKNEIVKTERKPNENQTETKQKPTNNINNEYEYENENNIIDIHTEDELPILVPEVVIEKVNYEKIVKRFNEMLVPMLPKVAIISDARKQAIKAIYNKHGTESIEKVFCKVKDSAFLRGDNEQGWKCNFDWIFKERNFIKILEGNYDDENRRTNNLKTDKRRANEKAIEAFIDYYQCEQGLADQVAKPF